MKHTAVLEQTIDEKICRVLACYDLAGEFCSQTQLMNGHINDTFHVCLLEGQEQRQYILQRINTYVFKNPVQVMDNIRAIDQYLAGRCALDDCCIISFMPSRDGANHVIVDGEPWRLCPFVANTTAYEQVENRDMLVSAGYAFGRFQALLADMPIDTLVATIPDFHNTPVRLMHLESIVAQDPVGRVSSVRREIDFLRQHRELASSLMALQEQGVLPLRVTHNDTKYNNILMDKLTGKPVCVIDLDTVMPGLTMFDFGDAIRFAANEAVEDETDLSRVRLNMDYYEAFTSGFMQAARMFVTPAESENMALGAIVMTLELAARFLADHIDGDRYFRIHRPGHNLDRARCQIRLAEDMLARRSQMEAIVRHYAS